MRSASAFVAAREPRPLGLGRMPTRPRACAQLGPPCVPSLRRGRGFPGRPTSEDVAFQAVSPTRTPVSRCSTSDSQKPDE